MNNNLKFLTLLMMVTVVGCGGERTIKPFKLEIQQGNVVTSEMLLKLRPGMTKSQVQFILGTPLLVDSFHTDRWDYFYQLRKQGEIVSQRRVILDFDGDALARVRGDVVPQGTNIDALVQQAQSAPKPAMPITETDENVGLVTTPIEAPLIESEQSVTSSEAILTESATVAPVTEATKVESTAEVMPTMEAAEAAVNPELSSLAETERVEAIADSVVQAEQEVIEMPVASVPTVESTPLQASTNLDAPIDTPVEKRYETAMQEVDMAAEAERAVPVLVESTNIVRPKLKMDRVMVPAPPEVRSRYRVTPTQSAIPTPPVMGDEANSEKAKMQQRAQKQQDSLRNEDEPGFFERTLKMIGF